MKITFINQQLINHIFRKVRSLFVTNLLYIGLIGIASFGLLACQPEQTAEQSQQQSAVANTPATDLDKNIDVRAGYLNKAYNTHLWQTSNSPEFSAKAVNINNVTDVVTFLGKSQMIDDKRLDYMGNLAKQYRFADNNQSAYLDLIDSKKYIEVRWYYANKKDTEAEQQTSIHNAQTVFALANSIMPEKGGDLVKRMLAGQRVQQTLLNGQKVSLAECEFNHCTLILQKKLNN